VSERVYHVEVSRERGSWLAHVRDLQGVQTWARNLPSLDLAVREAIALAEDLPQDAEPTLALVYEYQTGDADIDDAAAQLRAERKRVQQAERDLAARTAALARRLVTQYRMSVRDTAALLDVSMQRISQIAPAARASYSAALQPNAAAPAVSARPKQAKTSRQPAEASKTKKSQSHQRATATSK